MPGVKGAAVATQLPFSGRGSNTVVSVEGKPRQEGEAMAPFYQTAVTTGYFDTLGIPLITGREFRATDTADSGEVAIVDERLVMRDGRGVPIYRPRYVGEQQPPRSR